MARKPRKSKAGGKSADEIVEELIRPAPLADALSERYLSYALSTIMHRALPDVRDGLKPVHRRLLFAMRALKLDPNSGFKKSARVVGDVIGKFHPHGDQAVYDALVRLAQDFSVRYPLIDGQGNFGNIDGDGAAAMRYTEARLTEVADALLTDIDQDTVDFRETYDGEEKEPDVLPAAFPNLLANGANGIAVGMATSIPPHNAGELADGLLHLIKYPNATISKLVELIPGPDFPTGGILVEPQENIINAYKTGRGSFRLRSRWETEDLGRGSWQIVVTEIPFQVQKSRLIEKIAELINAKKLPVIDDIRDESAEDVRLVLVPKNKSVEPELVMEQMFKLTDLESRVSLNMNVLDGAHVPRVMSLREVLQAFLDHRKDVLIRKSNYRLGRIEARLEVLEGYLVAYLNLDEVIRIIREEDEPKKVMMKKFKLTDNQVEAILNMRLRALRKLEEIEIRSEHKALSDEQKQLKALLKSETAQWKAIADQIKDIKQRFGQKTELGARRTDFAEAPTVEAVPMEAFIEKEPVTVICSEKGWIRTIKGHVDLNAEQKFKDGDRGRFALHAETTDKLILFGTNGRFYTIGVDKLPGGRGHGEPVRLMIDLGNDQDIITLAVHDPARKLLVAATDGRGFITAESEVVAQTRNGKQVLNVAKGEEARVCVSVSEGADHLACVGENRKMIIFPMDDVPEMTRGRGVILQRYKDGGLSDATSLKLKEGLQWMDAAGRTHSLDQIKEWVGARAQAGRIVPKGFPRSNRFRR